MVVQTLRTTRIMLFTGYKDDPIINNTFRNCIGSREGDRGNSRFDLEGVQHLKPGARQEHQIGRIIVRVQANHSTVSEANDTTTARQRINSNQQCTYCEVNALRGPVVPMPCAVPIVPDALCA